MFIKICANTNLEDAQLAAQLGADAVGFVFAPSKRQVTAGQVAAITPHLPENVLTVGVFTTEDADEIVNTTRTAALRGVQLHHEPNPELVTELNGAFEGHVRLIQTVPYSVNEADNSQFEAHLRAALAMPAVWAVLIDAARGAASGGLGITFDWAHAAAHISRVYQSAEHNGDQLPRLIVAGGLRPENVHEAITTLQPWGVDVASGVEETPGKKEPERLRSFLVAARGSIRS